MNAFLSLIVAIATASVVATQSRLATRPVDPGTPRFVYSPRYDFPSYFPISSSHGLLHGDLDGANGEDVIVVANSIATAINVFLNDGTGALSNTNILLPIVQFPSGGALGDFDHDGDLDLVIVFEMRGQSVFLLNDGLGHFTPEPQEARLPGTMPTKSIAAGDFDSDGWCDIILGMTDGNEVRLFLNNRRGGFVDVTFTHMLTPVIGCVTHMVPADMDNDGDLDIVVAIGGICGQLQENVVLFNDGSAHMTSVILFGRREWSLNAAVGDVNSDGRKDIVFGNQRGAEELWINQGGWFTDASSTLPRRTVGYYTYAMAILDVNRDGAPDIIAAQSTLQGLISVFVNSGSGNFLLDTESIGVTSLNTYDMFVSDMDTDGDADIVVGANFVPLRPYGPKILVNARRQTLPVSGPAIGQPYLIDLWATTGQFLLPMVSSAGSILAVAPWGTLYLDPATMVSLPPMVARTPSIRLSVPIPNLPYLRGRSLHAQTMVIDLLHPTETHLTNATRDVIQ